MQKIVKDRQNIASYVIKNIENISFSKALWQQIATEMTLEKSYVMMLFPGGVKQLIAEIVSSLDQGVEKKIAKYVAENPHARIRDKIQHGIITRLFFGDVNKRLVLAKTLAFYQSAQNIDVYLPHLWHVADLIWRSIGDQATDFNYYSKRTILSFVYRSTWSYYVDDQSKNFSATLCHLDTAIDKVMDIAKIKSKYGSWSAIKSRIPFVRLL